jgi:hypothetical protein
MLSVIMLSVVAPKNNSKNRSLGDDDHVCLLVLTWNPQAEYSPDGKLMLLSSSW